VDADLILAGGFVWPVDGPARPGAVAIREGRILALGDADDVLWWRGPRTEVLDVGGGTVLPGFCDSHLHLLHHGIGLGRVEVGGRGPEGVLDAVRSHVRDLDPDAWAQGVGWDPERIPDDALDATLLDEAGGGRPVALWSRDFHAIRASTAALTAAGIDDDTPDPEGGTIVRDDRGRATGLLREAATDLVLAVLPEPTDEEEDAAIARVTADLHARGITAVHEMASPRPHEVYARLRAADRLRLRVLLFVRAERVDDLSPLELPAGHGDATLRLGGLKVFADGTLGSRTAWMLEDYADRPGSTGLRTTDADALRDLARGASRRGLALAIHAIGDGAVRAGLDAIEAARTIDGGRLRHRLEHAQCVAAEDLPRFAALGVHAAVQPAHILDDRDVAREAWGEERAARAHAYRSLLDAGAEISFGSDAPVAPPDPLLAIRMAVERTEGDAPPFLPEQALTLEEAVAAATAGGAAAAGLAGELGVIRPGARADLAVLSEDLTRGVEVLRDAAVAHTVFDGAVVWPRS
jgi:predicted amidohydrolase YtcJ